MRVINWLLALVALLALGLFGSQNMGLVTVSYYFGTYELPLFFLLVMAFLGGALLSGLAAIGDHLRLRGRLRREEKTVRRLGEELAKQKGSAAAGDEPQSAAPRGTGPS